MHCIVGYMELLIKEVGTKWVISHTSTVNFFFFFGGGGASIAKTFLAQQPAGGAGGKQGWGEGGQHIMKVGSSANKLRHNSDYVWRPGSLSREP